MKKSKRLSVLVKIEEAKEREEARKLTEYLKIVQDNKQKLIYLEGYLEEYRTRFMDLTHHGAKAGKIRASYAFISQLNTAISQQQETVQELELAVDEYRQNWLQAKQRMEILERTISKFRDAEQRHDQKMEQLNADELVQHKRRTD